MIYGIMKICSFTRKEIEYLRKECNFTPTEMELFDLRSMDVPLELCAEKMNVSLSTVKRISRRINTKIIKVC